MSMSNSKSMSVLKALVEAGEDMRAASEECDIGEGFAYAVPFHMWNEFLGKLDDAEQSLSRGESAEKDSDRYRWLQKQTPYRFGKIQASCVIDAVDTLYFRSDEFDKQVDAAMEVAK